MLDDATKTVFDYKVFYTRYGVPATLPSTTRASGAAAIETIVGLTRIHRVDFPLPLRPQRGHQISFKFASNSLNFFKENRPKQYFLDYRVGTTQLRRVEVMKQVMIDDTTDVQLVAIIPATSLDWAEPEVTYHFTIRAVSSMQAPTAEDAIAEYSYAPGTPDLERRTLF